MGKKIIAYRENATAIFNRRFLCKQESRIIRTSTIFSCSFLFFVHLEIMILSCIMLGE
jgi:hypothetical protein